MDLIECAANIGIACELVYATDKPPWAYNIEQAIKDATRVIASKTHKHLMISGLLSLVTYQLVNPTKTIHDCLVEFMLASDRETLTDAFAMMLKILPAQLPIVTANIEAIEQMSVISKDMLPIPDIVADAHIRYHTAFRQYCIMLKQLLQQAITNTEQAAIVYAYENITNANTEALSFEQFKSDIKGFIYFMMCFDPRNEFVPLYAPDKMSPDPAEIAMVQKLKAMKTASMSIAEMGVNGSGNNFGKTLQSFCVFVYKMSMEQHVPATISEFTEDYGADSYLFGQYCSDYYALESTLHVDHVKIAQKWWLQLIAVMYGKPEVFKNNRDDYMRKAIKDGLPVLNEKTTNIKIGFLRARIYVAAGALARMDGKNKLVDYVKAKIQLDDTWIKALQCKKPKKPIISDDITSGWTIKIGDFVQTLVDIKRSLIIPDSKGHTCTEFSWCYKCQAIQRSQRELERFREFGIINTDDKRVLAQIKFEQRNTDPMPVIAIKETQSLVVKLERRDMNSTDAFPS